MQRLLTQFVADSVASLRRGDMQRAQEKYAGAESWADWVPVSNDKATNLLLGDQCLRCAMSANALTCVPLQFNTMR
jgi:hypothetical protein